METPGGEKQLDLLRRGRDTHPDPGQAPGPVELIDRTHHRLYHRFAHPGAVAGLDEGVEPVHRLHHLPPGLRPRPRSRAATSHPSTSAG